MKSMAMRAVRPEYERDQPIIGAEPRRRRPLFRWLIPIGGGLLAAVLIVLSTPHVYWYLRLLLALIAFLYICLQSAAYLWTSDQG
jgi:uncharacterized membrane protein YdbT with pleckstrin-like domain